MQRVNRSFAAGNHANGSIVVSPHDRTPNSIARPIIVIGANANAVAFAL